MKICITAGGTGGHIYPALALADELKQRHHEIIYIGHQDKMEKEIVSQTSYPFFGLNNAGLSGNIFNQIKALWSQFAAIKEAKKILRDNKIERVVSFGGYVTYPVCEAARQLKIPYILHEQNAYAGKANKALEKKAQAVVICYEHAFQYFSNPQTYLLGNPRSSMVKQQKINPHILDEYKIDKSKDLIYFVMGSLGSETVNTVIAKMINNENWEDVEIVISSGTNNRSVYQEHLSKDIPVFSQVDQVSLLPHCDLVISRAGATSIAELMAFGVPSILIPSPYVANNHQYFNAKACVDQKAALMIEEKDLTEKKLSQMIRSTLKNKELLKSLKKNSQQLAFMDANNKMADLVEKKL